MKTIYDELKKDHEEVTALLDELSVAESAENRRAIVAKVRDALVPHSRAEEAVLYNVLRDLNEAKDAVAHSYSEHVKAETLLRGLQVTESVALDWKSGVEKLRDELAHHIAEEESRVFSAAKRVLSSDDAIQLGQAFTELKGKMGADVLSSNIELLANLMPARFRQSFAAGLAESPASRKAS